MAFEALAAIEVVSTWARQRGTRLSGMAWYVPPTQFLMLPIVGSSHLKAAIWTAPRPAARGHGVVVETGLGDGGEAARSVCNLDSPGCQQAVAQLLDLDLSEPLDRPKLEAVRPAFGRGLHRHHDGHFTWRPATPRAAAARATKMGVVHFHPFVGAVEASPEPCA